MGEWRWLHSPTFTDCHTVPNLYTMFICVHKRTVGHSLSTVFRLAVQVGHKGAQTHGGRRKRRVAISVQRLVKRA